MTFFKKYLFSSLLLFFSISSLAQSVDTSLLSNLSSQQIEAAREVLEGENLTLSDSEELPEIVESLVNIDKEESGEITKIVKFGYDFFSSMPTSLSAVGDLPLPNDYKISLRDQFRVILSGAKDQTFNLNVNLDGTILFPELGSIYVVGLTLKEVKEKLSNVVNQSYIGVNINISLQNLSAKKITIVGAVKTPGTYLINPFSTITGALAYSGGISEIGSLRDIKLIRNSGEVISFDLYDLLIKGDRSNDVNIEAGDTILVGAASQFVEINGAVNRPAIYEILEDEKVSDIVNFALGFTQTANKSNISISYLDLDQASVINKTAVSMDQSLKNALFVDIFNYLSDEKLGISVLGAVEEPGFYDLENYQYLEDLLEDLRFVEVYPWLAVLEQFDNDSLVKKTILFNLNDESTYQSIELLPNSKLYFTNINERDFNVDDVTSNLIDEYSLTLNLKNESYQLPVYGKFSIQSFIDLLGLDMSDVDEVATYISPLDSTVLVANYKSMNFTAKKYNNVSFRSPINDLITVNVLGAVSYPGLYTLKSDSTLEDLYKLVGDFKKEAFLDGIILTRENIRERQLRAIENSEAALNKSILQSMQKGEDIGEINLLSTLAKSINPENLGRIAGNFSPLSDFSTQTNLLDGDTIIVPKITNVINIIGEVLNPLAIEYSDRMDVNSAIIKAGGYQSFADKKRVYVIKANGLVEKTSRNIFTGNYSLEAGDTIVVPRKISTSNPVLRNLTPVTQILSDLAFSAAAIDNLSNN